MQENKPKEFDRWNSVKQKIDNKKDHRWLSVREVRWFSVGENIGTEENGKGGSFERPCLVMKVFGKESVLVLPLTSSKKVGDFYFDIGKIGKENTDSTAILSQVKILDTKRSLAKIGKLETSIFLELKKAMQKLLL